MLGQPRIHHHDSAGHHSARDHASCHDSARHHAPGHHSARYHTAGYDSAGDNATRHDATGYHADSRCFGHLVRLAYTNVRWHREWIDQR